MPHDIISDRTPQSRAVDGIHTPLSLAGEFRRQAHRRPHAAAVVWRDTVISYGQLHERALRARRQLSAVPGGPGAAVGVLATKTPDTIALVLALLGSGRPFVLAPADLGEATLAGLFGQARCTVVLSTGDVDRRPCAAAVDHVIEPAVGPVLPDDPPRSHPMDAVTFMFATSGSTGMPKVVPLTAGAVGRFVDWAADRFQVGPGRTVLSYAPLNFDLCLLDVWTTLCTGGCVVLVEPELATRPAYLHDLLRRHEVNVVQAVPMLFQLLLRQPDRAPLPLVTHVISTGDTMPRQCLVLLPELFPDARLYNVYGCTETNDSFVYEVPASTAAQLDVLPIGQPIPGVRAVVVDDAGAVLDGPGRGELYVTTPFQALGYLDARLDAGRLLPGGPTGAALFRSGDLVHRRSDGSMVLIGRTDHVVKVRGVRVSTHEVEQVLSDHPDVCAAAVVAIPDPVAGNTLHGFVQRRDGSALNSLQIRQHCARRLPRTSIPSAIRLVDQPLPRTATGKPDRDRIRRAVMEEN